MAWALPLLTAVAAQRFPTLGAAVHTGRADGIPTNGAGTQAPEAGRLIAPGARGCALAAELGVATGAVVGVVSAYGGAAIAAGGTGPVLESHVGRFAVIGREDRPHEKEEVADPPRCQGRVDGRGGVTGAEAVFADVGMRHGVVPRRRLGVQGNHAVRRAVLTVAKGLDPKSDLEVPQVHALQLNRVGGDGQDAVLRVVAEMLELLLSLKEFLENVPHVRRLHLGPNARALRVLAAVQEFAKEPLDLLGHPGGRTQPAPGKTDAQAPVHGGKFLLVLQEVADLPLDVAVSGRLHPDQAVPDLGGDLPQSFAGKAFFGGHGGAPFKGKGHPPCDGRMPLLPGSGIRPSRHPRSWWV